MKVVIQVPVLLSLGLILIAQLAFVPIALSVIFLLMWGVLFKYTNLYPSDLQQKRLKALKILLVLCALIAIYAAYGSFIGVEAGTAALAVFLFGKALELKTKRDLIIFFNFALFVSASLFLYSQSIWMTLMVICCLISCLFGLYRIQVSEFSITTHTAWRAARSDLRHILKFVALAIPFLILLFIFFPRFPPLWHIPISSGQGVTGISDRMSPGDIAELSQSSALAFRIIIDLKQLPPQQALYWRAMVLDQYDGQTWTSHTLNQQQYSVPPQNFAQQGMTYQYLAADLRQKWITSLEKSVPMERRFNLHQDFSITPNRLVQHNQPISLLWLGQANIQPPFKLSEFERQHYTQIPNDADPKAQDLARQLYAKSQSDSKVYMHKVIAWYQSQKFEYTLKPGRLGQNRVDDFLFGTQQGFCEHYASSFVLLMRYVGIPARVVVGYQGGQAAPDGKSWEVRQLDAHAWTEVFVDDQWERIDPTAIIAPQRLEMGMQNYISNDQQILGDENFSTLKYQHFSMLKQVRIWSDYAAFQWQDKVVGFDAQQQNKWMSWLGLQSRYAFILVLIAGIVGLGVLYYVIHTYSSSIQKHPIEKILDRFSRRLPQQDQKHFGESFKTWINRLAIEYPVVFDTHQLIQLHQNIVYTDQLDQKKWTEFEKLLNAYANKLKLYKKTCQKNQK